MRLYEHEGKALLARHGIQIPRGALWPDLPDIEGPLVVKAQVLAGKRGKQGGIRFAPDREGCRSEALSLLGSRLGDNTVEQVYVEERLQIERELYLSVLVDRDQRAPVLLATTYGGMDVEDVPDKDLIQLPINPLLGLRPFMIKHVVEALGLSGELARQAASTIEGLYAALKASEALLVEINPLVVTGDGRIVAADAKVVLDGEATFRHSDRPDRTEGGTPFEEACTALGPIGVEMDGNVAIIVAGAGLMMATVDLLSSAGVRLRAAIDSAGAAGNRPEKFADLTRLVIGLNPKVIFYNAYMQLAFCDKFARAIAAGVEGQNYQGKVVVRLKGRNLPEAKAILEPLGFPMAEDLQEAIQLVAAAAEE